jgi:hypothetical protein
MFTTYLFANYSYFRGLTVPICSNWSALASLLKLTKTVNADRMRRGIRHAAVRADQTGRTTMQIIFCPQRKQIRTDRLHRQNA